MSEKKENNVFISDCGNYIAIRIPGPQPTFDVWRHDGSEFWEGNKYVPVPSGEENCYNPRTYYTEEFTHPKKIVGSWTNLGHDNRKGEWIEAFELTLDSIETGKVFFVEFHTPLRSLAPQYRERRTSKLLEMGGDKIMLLEQQVTSLELSKRLKELEVKQDGLYSYFQYDKWNVLLRETKEIFAPNNECGCNKDNLICSAFTVAELGEMLPDGCYSQRGMRRKEGSKPGTPLALLWICAYKYDVKRAKTEADARAKMLIYLIENKLVEVEAK